MILLHSINNPPCPLNNCCIQPPLLNWKLLNTSCDAQNQIRQRAKGDNLWIISILLAIVACRYRTSTVGNYLQESSFNCVLHSQRVSALTEFVIALFFCLRYFLKLLFIPGTMQPETVPFPCLSMQRKVLKDKVTEHNYQKHPVISCPDKSEEILFMSTVFSGGSALTITPSSFIQGVQRAGFAYPGEVYRDISCCLQLPRGESGKDKGRFFSYMPRSLQQQQSATTGLNCYQIQIYIHTHTHTHTHI